MTAPEQPPDGRRADQEPLEAALFLLRQVDALATAAHGSPDAELQAYIQRWGQRQHHAAEMAAQLALVSIAKDVRRAVDWLISVQLPPDLEPPP